MSPGIRCALGFNPHSYPFPHYPCDFKISDYSLTHRCNAHALANGKYDISECIYLSYPLIQMQSGAEFSSWDGPHVIAALPSFDFQELMQKSIERAQAADYDSSGLFSLSPLSRPEPSRPPSPVSLTPTILRELSPPPATSATHTSCKPHLHVDRVKKKKSQSHACRSKQHAKAKQSCFSPYESRPAVRAKYVDDAASIQTSTSLESSSVVGTAYVALDDCLRSKKTYRLHEAVGSASKLGFVLQEWDGKLSLSSRFSRFSSNDLGRTPTPILDREGRLVAILAGHPDDESWLDLSKQATDLLEEARG